VTEQARPWHRLIEQGEGTKAYEAANAYFTLGPARSIAEVARELGKSEALLGRWSRAYRWVERAGQWDDHAASLERERNEVERREARRRMLDTHARLGQRAASVAGSWLDEYADGGSKRASDLTPAEAIRLLEAATRVEREGRPRGWNALDEAGVHKFVGNLVDVALRYIPEDAQTAFLTDLTAEVGAVLD
jgi:hypothetical protein